ncbi:hypothetical protein BOSE62_40698 [Bosea sp. 62]|nr:hypothetical protein BOSE46_120083 [Bosea sp. 46]CAD5259134.1 hypothetical protein BOSE21B_110295 [Bosea sp. 21B]CAD5281621.1 hypothetical protein BOSE7B_40919 [Bosea sp. 7B]VVT57961.1 hypothetical protein BOS5A_200347 [Bosea sp. EC-HK365B]VXB87546.1 hypothetical protein BOSE125_160038 [Bosea sp. 125]VXC53680.1 hypothetical protein BOSE62_40698 [Bosea sp. 62]
MAGFGTWPCRKTGHQFCDGHKKTALWARSRAFGLEAERHRGRAGAACSLRRRVGFVVMRGYMFRAETAVNDGALEPQRKLLSWKERSRGEVFELETLAGT